MAQSWHEKTPDNAELALERERLLNTPAADAESLADLREGQSCLTQLDDLLAAFQVWPWSAWHAFSCDVFGLKQQGHVENALRKLTSPSSELPEPDSGQVRAIGSVFSFFS
jgi:hypothetical protein